MVWGCSHGGEVPSAQLRGGFPKNAGKANRGARRYWRHERRTEVVEEQGGGKGDERIPYATGLLHLRVHAGKDDTKDLTVE